MKFVTATGKEIEYIYDAGIGDVVAEYASPSIAAQDIESLTKEALSTGEFVDDNGQVMGTYHDLILDSTELEDGDDNKTICHFHFRTMSDLERDVRVLQDEMIEVQEALVEG